MRHPLKTRIVIGTIVTVFSLGASSIIFSSGNLIGGTIGAVQYKLGNPMNATAEDISFTFEKSLKSLGFGAIWLGVAFLLGRTVGSYVLAEWAEPGHEDEDEDEDESDYEPLLVPKRCRLCQYYAWNNRLPCGVQPSLPPDCGDFVPLRIKN